MNAVAVQTDGKIVVAGFTLAGMGQGGSWTVARFNSNGALDNTFGDGGLVRRGPIFVDRHASAIVIQPDGRIVVAGYQIMPPGIPVILERYNTDGTLDSTFGQGGQVTDNGSSYGAWALARQSDGKLVVAIYRGSGNLVERYESNGTLDATFGNNGQATIGLYDPREIAIQSDGRIVTVGSICSSSCSGGIPNTILAAVRLNSNGTADDTFGSNGVVTGSFADAANGVAVQSDDKIVVVGGQNTGYLVVARYLSSWLLGSVVSSSSASGNNPSVTDAAANFSAATTGSGAITIAQYASNPGGEPSFSASGQYYDIHLSGTFSSVVVSFCGVDTTATIYFWDGSVWHAVSNQTVVGGCVQVTVNASTVPNLTQLTGTLFGAGSAQQLLPPPSPTPKAPRQEDSYEPDDGMGFAHTITGKELHNFCGPKDEDWVKFPAKAGWTYHIKADPPTNFPTEPHLELYVNGGVVAQNDHYFSNIAEIWWWNIGSDQSVYVRATELKGRGDCGSSTYTLSVEGTQGKP